VLLLDFKAPKHLLNRDNSQPQHEQPQQQQPQQQKASFNPLQWLKH
jgi:hypothetical protein